MEHSIHSGRTGVNADLLQFTKTIVMSTAGLRNAYPLAWSFTAIDDSVFIPAL